MKVVDQGKVPGVIGIDLVVCRHLHPLFEVGQDRYSLHRGHGSLINIAIATTARMPRGGWTRTRCTFITGTSPRRQGRFDGSLDLVHLVVMEGLSGLHPGRLLSHIIIQWDPSIVSAISRERQSHADGKEPGSLLNGRSLMRGK